MKGSCCELAEFLGISSLLKLLKAQGKYNLVTVNYGDTVEQAISFMIENDFSQLSVRKNGKIVGMISYSSIVKRMLLLADKDESQINLLEASVEDIMDNASVEDYDSDLFDLLNTLAGRSFILTQAEDGLDEIITSYDVVRYFREHTESFLALKIIEDCLRQIINEKFDESSFKDAAKVALKCQEDKVPERVNKLSFGRYIKFVSHHWEFFSDFFGDKTLSLRYLNKARRIRNDICHFRGPISKSGRVALMSISYWLDRKRICYFSKEVQQLPIVSAQESLHLK